MLTLFLRTERSIAYDNTALRLCFKRFQKYSKMSWSKFHYNALNSLRNGAVSGFLVLGLPGFFPIVLSFILRFLTPLINHRRRQGHNSCVSNNTFSWRKILTNTNVIYRYKAYVKVAAATIGSFSPLYLSIAWSFKQYNNIFCRKKM